MKSISSSLVVLFLFVISPAALADFGDPLAGLSSADRGRFTAGRAQFMDQEGVADGLGPVFNENSCVTCHTASNNAVGGGSTRLETRFGRTTNGTFDPLASLGGSLRQDHAIGAGDATASLPDGCAAFVPETVPSQANVVAGRRTTPLFGLGFVDAVPDSTFIALANQERASNASTAGVVAMVPNPDANGATTVGKFGWKAQNATLHVFAGDAYLNEMGITSPQFQSENCPQGNCALLACNPRPKVNDVNGTDVTGFTDFMTLLDAPPRGPLDPKNKEGENVFGRIGCTDCHTASLTTGSSPVAALSNKTFHPYSDFLLHDMGSLGDGITQNNATGNLMRTAPLWGLRVQQSLLHDGRATTVTQAIQAHAGQGAASRAAFNGLNATQQGKLLAFLASL